MTTLVVLFAFSLVVSLALTPAVRLLADRWGLIDKPDGRRKLHARTTPVAGGIAILLASLIALGVMLVAGRIPWTDQFASQATQLIGLAVAAVLISGVGILDDWGRLRRRHKLLGQVLAISVVVSSGLVIATLRLAYWDVELGLFSIPFTVFFLLGAINSLNLLDGMDGLLGTLCLIITLAFTGMAVLGEKWATACIAVTVAGAVLGFLRYNLPPATIFLGDTGSMLIGLVVGSLAIMSSMKGPATVALAAPLAALALPILDTTAAIFRRKLTGRSIYTTDRGHLHHCLLRRGYSTLGVLALFSLFCLVAVAGSLLSVAFNSEWIALLAAATVAGTLIGMRWFGHTEAQLALDRVKTVSSSFLRLRQREKPMESQVRLQGSASWTELWAAFTESALSMNLKSVFLDINAPGLHEGYHARWQNPSHEEGESGKTFWNAALPLVFHGQTVGRVEVTGGRDDQPVWMKIASLTELVADVELALYKIAENLAQENALVNFQGPHRPLVAVNSNETF